MERPTLNQPGPKTLTAILAVLACCSLLSISLPTSPANPMVTPRSHAGSAHPVAAIRPLSSVSCNISFYQWGLPLGTNWSVSFNGTLGASTGNWTNFTVAPGLYSYAITPSPGYYPYATAYSGNLSLSRPNNTFDIHFQPELYAVTFSEGGLPGGTYWTVELGSQVWHSVTESLTFQVTNGSYTYGVGQTGSFVPTPANGNLTVMGAGRNVSVNFSAAQTYAVTFVESGLPTGTAWSVWLGGATQSSNNTTVTVDVVNGTYSFVATATGYETDNAPDSVQVEGANRTFDILFVLAAPNSVLFQESGLPTGTVWTVYLGDQVQTSSMTEPGVVPFRVPNGTFAYSIPNVSNLTPTPPSGNVTVSGTSLTITVQFGPALYATVFAESGLPTGTPWSITVNNNISTTNAAFLTVDLPNGTYAYSVSAVPGFAPPASGEVTISGSVTSVLVVFERDVFSLSFEETGLPNGTPWGVAIGNEIETSDTPNVTFDEMNGTYVFVILAIAGYTSAALNPAVVNGANTVVAVDYALETYPVLFVEGGLPAGSNWSVTVSNATTGFSLTEKSSTDTITFYLTNGSYSVSVNFPSGYNGTALPSSVTVTGGTTTEGLSLLKTGQGNGLPGTGAQGGTSPNLWAIIAGALGGATVVGAAALLIGGRGRRRPPSSSITASSPYYPYVEQIPDNGGTRP